MVLLVYLKSLPCLSSLTVCIDNFYDDLADVYQIIFHLSNLKYFKLKILDYQVSHINIPIAIDEQFSSLQYLVISHPVYLDELAHLLSYTPKVTHLYCSNIIETEHIIKSEELIELKNLIHLTITTNYLTFDKFEQFFLKLFAELKSIKIYCSHHAYLNPFRWEELIKDKMIHLKRFMFCCADDLNDDFELTTNHQLINNFSSSFWMDKRWILTITIDDDKIFYLIRADRYILEGVLYLKKSFYSFFSSESCYHAGKGVRVYIKRSQYTPGNEIFMKKIKSLLSLMDIACMDMDCREMSGTTLIEILYLFPNLEMITIQALASIRQLMANKEIFYRFLEINKIKKIYLGDTSTDKIDSIFVIFRHVQIFQMEIKDNNNVPLIVLYIVKKIKKNIMVKIQKLCFITHEAPYNIMDKLKKMINSENLLKNYIIYRQFEKLYLEWDE